MNYPLRQLGMFFSTRDSRVIDGVYINCPNCGAVHAACFANPIGGTKPCAWARVTWNRTGETLETLSLSPSFMAVGHYHSWVRDGQLQVDSAFSCTQAG